MRPTSIALRIEGKAVTVDAWEHPDAPGMATHYDADDNDWTISHVRSGCALLVLDSPEQAVAAMLDLAQVGIDWTLSGPAIEACLGGREMPLGVEAVMFRWSATMTRPSAPSVSDIKSAR